MNRSCPIIGLTGAPGAGKNAIADLWQAAGCVVVDADALGHQALCDSQVKSAIETAFGSRVFEENGNVSRKKLGEYVFGNKLQLKILESLIHPWVHAQREIITAQALKGNCVAVIENCALLFEAELNGHCDHVVWVETPFDVRLQRVASRGWNQADLERRESNQLPIVTKRKLADSILENHLELDTHRQRFVVEYLVQLCTSLQSK